jgi:uncharacterized domain HDIG
MEALRIRVDQVEPGMVVATDVYNSIDQLLVPKGTELDDRILTRLKYYNIEWISVYKKAVEEKGESYIEMLRSTTEFKKFNRTYVNSIKNIQNSFNRIISGDEEIDIDAMLEETDRVLKEARNGAHLMEMLHGIRDYDDLTYVHCLNVSLICSIFAGWLRLSAEETKTLTLCGLLHDIGKILIPKEIINKKEKLTNAEYETIKTHTFKGFQILKDQPVDIRVKFAALMHHERSDGSGYPNGFIAEQIDDFAKIVAIADVYDAMTSNRLYRTAICPFDVVESFEKDGFLKYDPGFLITFMERIVESYLHNIVRLNDGREGEVVLINKLSLSRPVIKIGSEYIDLSKNHKLSIETII